MPETPCGARASDLVAVRHHRCTLPRRGWRRRRPANARCSGSDRTRGHRTSRAAGAPLIPLGDGRKRRRWPVATIGLVFTEGLAFLWMLHLPAAHAAAVVTRLALVPARLHPLLVGDARALPQLLTLVSCLFLHAGLLHLAGNLLFLWVFGQSVEDEMGPAGFLGFFVLCGILGGLVHALVHPSSMVPTVGASGAISGVLGAYLGLHPRAKLESVVLVAVWPLRLELPAGAWLLGWLLLQILAGLRALDAVHPLLGRGSGTGGGVAVWAHVGGFLAGLALFRFFLLRVRPRPRLQPARRS
jgi:membrane associated rhomboid family serine protease